MSIGAQLRASREARGLTIDALAHTTRVQPRILAAIERDDVGAVPPRPFGRGFVRAYAREIGLDADQTARDYFAQFAPVATPPDREPSAQIHTATEHPRRNWIVVVSAGLAAGLAAALIVSRPTRIAPSRGTPAAPAIVGTSGASTPSSSPAAGDGTSSVAKPAGTAQPA